MSIFGVLNRSSGLCRLTATKAPVWQTPGSWNHIPVAWSDLEDTSLLGHE